MANTELVSSFNTIRPDLIVRSFAHSFVRSFVCSFGFTNQQASLSILYKNKVSTAPSFGMSLVCWFPWSSLTLFLLSRCCIAVGLFDRPLVVIFSAVCSAMVFGLWLFGWLLDQPLVVVCGSAVGSALILGRLGGCLIIWPAVFLFDRSLVVIVGSSAFLSAWVLIFGGSFVIWCFGVLNWWFGLSFCFDPWSFGWLFGYLADRIFV